MTDPEKIGRRETDDDATLAAFYFGEGLWSHYRRAVLAACAEVIRAKAVSDGKKLSESRIDDLAHSSSAYLEFLAHHLDGRREWMARYIKDGGLK